MGDRRSKKAATNDDNVKIGEVHLVSRFKKEFLCDASDCARCRAKPPGRTNNGRYRVEDIPHPVQKFLCVDRAFGPAKAGDGSAAPSSLFVRTADKSKRSV